MKLGKLLYVKSRAEWRAWLAKNHKMEKEIWLIYYRKSSGKSRISYDDAVEEALCFGWIDSTAKNVNSESYAQRFSPRRPKSPVSELNKVRIRKLISQKLMTPAGLAAIGDISAKFKIPKDIIAEIKKNKQAWSNFQKFPETYKTIRIAFIDGARKRPEEFKRRLNNFIKITAQGKKFGSIQ